MDLKLKKIKLKNDAPFCDLDAANYVLPPTYFYNFSNSRSSQLPRNWTSSLEFLVTGRLEPFTDHRTVQKQTQNRVVLSSVCVCVSVLIFYGPCRLIIKLLD